MERFLIANKSKKLNDADRYALANILIKAGYAVKTKKAKEGNVTRTFVEYWEED